MSQRTQARKGVSVRAGRPRLLNVIGAAAIMLMPLLSAGSAQASTTDVSRQAANAVLHVYGAPHFSGPASWLYGNNGQCTYVGDTWNDKVRSARTESNNRVEVWEHADCTGYALVVDRTGYGNIGPWVSAFRALS